MGAQVTRVSSKTRDMYESMANCSRYNPCPICYRCMNKASHLYVACQDCDIPFCVHDDRKRNMVIKRENFAIDVSDEVGQAFKALGEKIDGEV